METLTLSLLLVLVVIIIYLCKNTMKSKMQTPVMNINGYKSLVEEVRGSRTSLTDFTGTDASSDANCTVTPWMCGDKNALPHLSR